MSSDEPSPTPTWGAPPSWSPPPKPRTNRWVLAGGIAVAVLAVIAVIAAFIRLPYVIVSPGDATDVTSVVTVKGAPTYRHTGSLLFLTVSVSTQRPNVYALAQAWVSGDSQILDESDVLGPNSRREDARLNQAMMTSSEDTAKYVALKRLGYDVPVHGAGAEVAQVVKGSPADGKLRVHDVITAVNGQPVQFAEQVSPIVKSGKPGSEVTFAVTRDGKPVTVAVTTRADKQGQAQVGIGVVTKDLKVDYPVDVTIDPGQVSGPSAGLAFTLTIIEDMTKQNLTGGNRVAITGTIDSDGSVGVIGGIEQKAITAHRAGATLMIVPASEAAAARKHASGMPVVGVKTLQEALDALHAYGGAALPPAQALRPAA